MQETIERFYAAFDRRDGDTMAACYARGARFSDPAFGELRGEEPGAMWRMLTGQATDLRVALGDHGADEAARTGHADWTAHYTFSQTGRPVTNHVRATFRFDADGLFAEHDDAFSFQGLLLGWTPVLRGAVRRRARGNLERFMAS